MIGYSRSYTDETMPMIEERKRSLLDRVRMAFRIDGSAPAGERPRELLVFIRDPREPGRRQLIGRLTEGDEMWTFAYDASYAASDLAPISAFPDKHKSYQSEQLWPFFGVRIPPLEREDVRAVVDREGLNDHDKLGLLGALSKRAVTSPYEFELNPAGA